MTPSAHLRDGAHATQPLRRAPPPRHRLSVSAGRDPRHCGSDGSGPGRDPRPTSETARTNRVVFVSNRGRKRAPGLGFAPMSRRVLELARCPVECPTRNSSVCPKQENLAGMRDCGWRDPDSNRGHHDFQTWANRPLNGSKLLDFLRFSAARCVLADVRKLRSFAANSGTRSDLSAQSHVACSGTILVRFSLGQRPWRSVSEDAMARDGSSPVLIGYDGSGPPRTPSTRDAPGRGRRGARRCDRRRV